MPNGIDTRSTVRGAALFPGNCCRPWLLATVGTDGTPESDEILYPSQGGTDEAAIGLMNPWGLQGTGTGERHYGQGQDGCEGE